MRKGVWLWEEAGLVLEMSQCRVESGIREEEVWGGGKGCRLYRGIEAEGLRHPI